MGHLLVSGSRIASQDSGQCVQSDLHFQLGS
jgi:hypothetical protein